jgi:hypothetical protein
MCTAMSPFIGHGAGGCEYSQPNFASGLRAFEQCFHHLLHDEAVAQRRLARRAIENTIYEMPGDIIPI